MPELPTAVAILIGIAVLYILFKTGKFLLKLVFLLVAVGLVAAAYWWFTHH